MGNIITFHHVNWTRNGKDILSDINWTINPGEHWGILGLNGSGKTSLLNIITGYHFPSSGEVTVLGNRFGETNLPELRKKIGFVSSSLGRFSHILEHESIEEIIVSGKFASFGLYEEVQQEDWKKADSLIGQFGLRHLQGKPYSLLSEGERRKVLIARAVMNDPEILILDEPCSGLDILSREQVLSLTQEIMGQDRLVLYVTHHIEELVKGITHVLLLHQGKVLAAGPKKEVITEAILSEAFEIPIHVRWEEERPWLSIKKMANSIR
jgi:iron complex transport system ATP-binding protein